MTEPTTLVCMRLIDMTRMHPAQDDSHACSRCGHRVGVYPTGQRALEAHPRMKILCVHCAMADRNLDDLPNQTLPAGSIEEIIKESRNSYDVSKK